MGGGVRAIGQAAAAVTGGGVFLFRRGAGEAGRLAIAMTSASTFARSASAAAAAAGSCCNGGGGGVRLFADLFFFSPLPNCGAHGNGPGEGGGVALSGALSNGGYDANGDGDGERPLG